MRIQFRYAAPGAIFTRSAAQAMIGQRPAVNQRAFEGGPIVADYGSGTIVAVEVIEDGAAVFITLDADLPDLPLR